MAGSPSPVDENPYKSPETRGTQGSRRFAIQVAQVTFTGLAIIGLLLPIASIISIVAWLATIAPPLPWTLTYTVTGTRLLTFFITGVFCLAIGLFGRRLMRR